MKPFSSQQITIVIGFVVAALLLGGIFLVAGYRPLSYRASEREVEKPLHEAVDSAPDFSLLSHGGTPVSLSSFSGETPVIINFWAAWCPFCLEELKDFKELAQEHRDELIILAVNRAEPRERVVEYVDTIQPPENLVFLLDPDDAVYARYGGRVMPYSVFVDKSGRIQYVKLGPMNLEEMRIRTQELVTSNR